MIALTLLTIMSGLTSDLGTEFFKKFKVPEVAEGRMKWSPLGMVTGLSWLEKCFPSITEAEHLAYVSLVDHRDGSGLKTLRDTDKSGFLPCRCSPEGIRVQ